MSHPSRVERLWLREEGQEEMAVASMYLLAVRDEGLFLDVCIGSDEAEQVVLETIEQMGAPKFHTVLLTHFHGDHVRGVERLRKHWPLRILVHAKDAPHVKRRNPSLQIDGYVDDGTVLELGGQRLEVLHTPGHTHGHCSLWWPERGILFAGDLVTSEGSTWIGPPEGDMTAYMSSLERCLALPIETVAPGHGSWITPGLPRIKQLLERRQRREEEILALARKGYATPKAIAAELYGDRIDLSGGVMASITLRTVYAHLEKLAREGLLREVTEKVPYDQVGDSVFEVNT